MQKSCIRVPSQLAERLKSYLRYKTMTSKSVPSEEQVKMFLISYKI